MCVRVCFRNTPDFVDSSHSCSVEHQDYGHEALQTRHWKTFSINAQHTVIALGGRERREGGRGGREGGEGGRERQSGRKMET